MSTKFNCFYGDNTKTLLIIPSDSTVGKLKEIVKNRYNYEIVGKALFIDGVLIDDDNLKLEHCRRGFDEILIADQSTVHEQKFYFADQNKYDTVTISDSLSIQLIENLIASKLGSSVDQLIFDMTFGPATNYKLESFRTFNFGSDYVIPLISKVYRQRNQQYKYPQEILNAIDQYPSSSSMTVTFRSNQGASKDNKALCYSMPTQSSSEAGEKGPLSTSKSEISKTFTNSYSTSEVFTESTINLLKQERENSNRKRRGKYKDQPLRESLRDAEYDIGTNEIPLPSTQPVPFGIPPHQSVSIQGLKDHLLLSGKKKFTDKEFGDFISLLSNAEPSEEIYIQNEQYFNENQFKYAKILYQLSGIECWFQYMICNTEQSFHLENNLFILNEILKYQQAVIPSLMNSSTFKSLFARFTVPMSTEAKIKIIEIFIAMIDTNPIQASKLLCTEVKYQNILLQIKDVPIKDLHELNKHLESTRIQLLMLPVNIVEITDHSILFTIFYADMSLCKNNILFLIEIYMLILKDFRTIDFSDQEIASFNNLILNTDESFNHNPNFRNAKEQLDLLFNPHSSCCLIL